MSTEHAPLPDQDLLQCLQGLLHGMDLKSHSLQQINSSDLVHLQEQQALRVEFFLPHYFMPFSFMLPNPSHVALSLLTSLQVSL